MLAYRVEGGYECLFNNRGVPIKVSAHEYGKKHAEALPKINIALSDRVEIQQHQQREDSGTVDDIRNKVADNFFFTKMSTAQCASTQNKNKKNRVIPTSNSRAKPSTTIDLN